MRLSVRPTAPALMCALLATVLASAGLPVMAAAPPQVAFRQMEHHRVACGATVVYEADVNAADPSPVQVRAIWQVGALKPYGDLAVVGLPNAQHANDLAGPAYSAVTATLVVKALHPDGRADVALVYTLVPHGAGAANCAFVDTTIPVGHAVQLTASDRTPVTLTILLPTPPATP